MKNHFRRVISLACLLPQLLCSGGVLAGEPPTTTLADGTIVGPVSKFDAGEAAGRVLLAPILIPIKTIQYYRQGHSGEEVAQNAMINGAPYLAGYIILSFGVNHAFRTYFSIDHQAYKEFTQARMAPSPKKVLLINAVHPSDKLYAYAEADFAHLYGDHPDVTLLKPASYQDLIEQIKHLPQDASFDRIEIFGHGGPGKLTIGEISKKNPVVKISDLARLREIHPNISKPGAELRALSCSLGASTPTSDEGPTMLRELGSILMPRGGKVLAATRKILVQESGPALKAVEHLMGIANVNLALQMLPSAWRDYKSASAKAIEIDIPSSGGEKSGCLHALVRFLK